MSNSNLKVLVVGLGDPVPSFILRRLHKLDKEGVHLIIVCRVSIIKTLKGLSHATIIPYYRAKGWSAIKLLFNAVFKIAYWSTLWPHAEGVSFSARSIWLLENCQWLYFPTPHVIQLQWLSSASRYACLKASFPGVPIIVSVRGSQATVQVHLNSMAAEMYTLNSSQADFMHCVSNDILERCVQLNAPREKLFVNYNGINLSRFTPAHTTKLESATLRLVSVGALIWRKGYLYQLQILKELKDNGHSVSLNIIGSGSDEIGLRYTAHRLGIEGQVVFEGHQKEEQIISRLKSSDIYLSASAAEGLPNTLVEAAACGLPIVTFECEGVREVIEENRTGYIVDFGDVKTAAQKIAQLKDVAKRAEMGRLAREKMEKEFDESYWVVKMIDTYKSFLS